MTVSDPTGYVVRLASGGPRMTIEDFRAADQTISVVWADRAGLVHRSTFPVSCVRVIRSRPA